MTAATHRSAADIGRTEQGPRPLPGLGAQSAGSAPDHVDTVLDNGLRVLAVRRSGVPMVELRTRVPLANAADGHAARAELLASTMFAGSERRSRDDVDIDLARAGADLGSSVDPERLTVSGNGLSTGLDVLLDVAADAVTAAAHRDHEVEREKERLTAHLQMARSQPRTIARLALQRRRYGDHPATRELPRAADLATVTRDDVLALREGSVVPRGSIMTLVGDVEPQRAVDAVARAFHAWVADTTAVEMAALPTLAGAPVEFVHRPGAVQSQLRLSAQAVPRTDPRYTALQVANLVFGGYFSARWSENIREDKGYTYSAHSYLEFDPHSATLLVETDTATAVTAATLHETRLELARMVDDPPSQDEIESARQYAIGSLSIGMSSQAGLASGLHNVAVAGLDLEWLRSHPERLAKVTRDEVVEAAAEFFAPSRFTGVVVGDADVVGDELRELGGVDIGTHVSEVTGPA